MPKSFRIVIGVISAVLVAALLVILYAYSQRNYMKNAYPIKYSEYVEKYSEKYELDPYFVYAIIRTESGFTPSATSPIGARGLMQVTSDTFDWIKNRLGDKESDFDSMYEPEKAVEYGVYLISYLTDTLGGYENVLCGYHAGVNKTKSWLTDADFSKDGNIIVEKIPYDDTSAYVKKVMKTYEIYSKLYK